MRPVNQDHNRPTGIVLAGGHGTRMGRDKAWLDWQGQSLLQHIIQGLLPKVEPLIVVGRKDQKLPELPSGVFRCDDAQPDQGPVRGLEAGLQHAPKDRPVFLTACDFPFVVMLDIGKFAVLLGEYDAAIPRLSTEAHAHPLVGIYRPDILPMVTKILSAGRRSLHALLDCLKVRWVEDQQWRELDPESKVLLNVNSLSEYHHAQTI